MADRTRIERQRDIRQLLRIRPVDDQYFRLFVTNSHICPPKYRNCTNNPIAFRRIHRYNIGIETQKCNSWRLSCRKSYWSARAASIFAQNFLKDILTDPELRTHEVTLMDIDAGRLANAVAVAGLIAAKLGIRFTPHATTDLREALNGANYVITNLPLRDDPAPGTRV